jgi:PLP dependent protein
MTARETELANNLQAVQERIDKAVKTVGRSRSEITLIAVTKFFPVSDVEILYDLGLRDFGENRDSEGADKSLLLPIDARWHFQGQVQSRKIRSIATWADVIHSLDSLEHAAKFNEILGRELGTHEAGREFFVQVNLEPERRDRGGVSPAELEDFLASIKSFASLNVSGLMAVLPIDRDIDEGFAYLARLRERFGLLKLSMGMSSDFEAAIRAGATHIRVGSSILGSRPTLA